MPIEPLYPIRLTLEGQESPQMLLEKHAAKIENLRVTILDFLFDPELKRDYDDLGTLEFESPIAALTRTLIEKYGDPPDESLFTDQDIQDIHDAREKTKMLKGAKCLINPAGNSMYRLRRILDDALELLSSLSHTSQMARIIPPKTRLETLEAKHARAEMEKLQETTRYG